MEMHSNQDLNLNFGPGDTIANAVTVKIGDGGQIWLSNAVGSVEVIVDLSGYYLPSADAPQTRFTTLVENNEMVGGAPAVTIASLTLEAGTYLLEASVQLNDGQLATLQCSVGDRAVTLQVTALSNSYAMVGGVDLSAGGPVSLVCASRDADEDVTVNSIVFSASRAEEMLAG
ncbi:MAG: hypothetical protein GEV08_07805 [Acidimicrobiia bacterium]|nr:hypothetical protein [Acidimicrobiia bacterium]